MQAELIVKCGGCEKKLAQTGSRGVSSSPSAIQRVDTADDADRVKDRVDRVILAHRQDCYCYRQEEIKCPG